jgi:hypothetical protein
MHESMVWSVLTAMSVPCSRVTTLLDLQLRTTPRHLQRQRAWSVVNPNKGPAWATRRALAVHLARLSANPARESYVGWEEALGFSLFHT